MSSLPPAAGKDEAGSCLPCSELQPSALVGLDQVQERLQSSLPMWTLNSIHPQGTYSMVSNATTTGDTTTGPVIPRIQRRFIAKDFKAALDCITRMGAIADAQGHHPDFHLTSYRNVQVDLYTHKLKGITENDLILAEMLDQVPVEYSPAWLREHPEVQPRKP